MKNSKYIKNIPPSTIIEKLKPYISTSRQQRIEQVIRERLLNIQLAIECPADINNVMAVIRSAEAFGIDRLHIIQPQGQAQHIVQISKGAYYWVDLVSHTNLDSFLSYAKKEGLLLAGACVSGTITISLDEVPVTQPICLLLGNEQRGLSTEAVKACDYVYKIPMAGMSESLNLSVAAAISLYDTTLRRRAMISSTTDASTEQLNELRARFYLNSVEPRLADGLFKTREPE